MAEPWTQLARKGRRERFLLLGGIGLLLVLRLLSLMGDLDALDFVLVLLAIVIVALVVVLVSMVRFEQRRKQAQLRALPDEWFRTVGMVKPVELVHCGLAPPRSVVKIGTLWTSGLVGVDVAVAPEGLRIYPNARGVRAGMAAVTVLWSWVRDAEIVRMPTWDGGIMLVVQYTDGREFSIQTTRRDELQKALDRVAA
jgi:hypothetical protein